MQNMPKVLLKSTQKKCYFFAALLVFFFTIVRAQDKIVITYGNQINLGDVPGDVQFEVQGPEFIRLKGTKINQYSFDKPGIYSIKVHDKKHSESDCGRLHLPDEIKVEVSRIRMIFGSSLTFSSPIVKNVDTQGIVLKVPVQIQTYDHLPAVLNQKPVASAGIGSNIVAHLKTKATELPEGQHLLEYVLSGLATENAYLMFDFVDANDQVQSISVLTPVKN